MSRQVCLGLSHHQEIEHPCLPFSAPVISLESNYPHHTVFGLDRFRPTTIMDMAFLTWIMPQRSL